MSDVIYSRASGVDQTRSGDRLVLYHADGRKALVLNPTGALVWQILEKPATFSQVHGSMQEQFPQVDADLLRSDLQAYLESMLEQEVVTRFD